MEALVEGARRGGARAVLFIEVIRADAFTHSGDGARIARFGGDLAGQKRMRRVDAGIDDADGDSTAVVADGPGPISLDDRPAVGEIWPRRPTRQHRFDVAGTVGKNRNARR